MSAPVQQADIKTELTLPRLYAGLLLLAGAYALLSVCLYLAMGFTFSSPAFFMFYVCAGMPLGAFFARRIHGTDLGLAAFWVLPLGLVFPVMAWLAAHGPMPMMKGIFGDISAWDLWGQLLYQTLVSLPLFFAWGAAEYTGFRRALGHSGGRFFYLAFAWALAGALVVANRTVPWWGFLPTVALAPLLGLAACEAVPFFKNRRPFLRPLLWVLSFLFLAGAFVMEKPFTFSLFPNVAPFGVGHMLKTAKQIDPATDFRVLRGFWGKYGHVAFLGTNDTGKVFGSVNGFVHWNVLPKGDYPDDYERTLLGLIPPEGRVCVLGPGGGKQVSLALDQGAQSVVAVDLIGEVLSTMAGELSWANNGVYRSPRVRTVCADGRRYMDRSEEKFDFILLPYTEYWATNLKTLFEPAHDLHTKEAFETIGGALAPGGLLCVVKGMDKNQVLFRDYAATLSAAGLHAVGLHPPWKPPPSVWELFILLASPEPWVLDEGIRREFLAMGWTITDFSRDPVQGRVIEDDSPWIWGMEGLFLPEGVLRSVLAGAGILALLGLAGLAGYSLRTSRGQGGRGLLVILAGFLVGVNAVYLENAVIFWFVRNLLNSLSAFFVGATLFLFLWGASSLALANRRWTLGAGAAGLAAALVFALFPGFAPLWWMGLMALGAGLFFPLVAMSHPKNLLVFYAADALGGLVGGLLGIWLPVFLGLGGYFSLVPWFFLACLVLVLPAAGKSGREVNISRL